MGRLEHGPPSGEGGVGVVIVAAGQGSRIGGDRPKQLRPLAGRALALHSTGFFLNLREITHAVFVVARAFIDDPAVDEARRLGAASGKLLKIIEGGPRRQDSVLEGVRALSADVEIVLVHDAARPFPPREPVLQSIGAARRMGGAILALPILDTVKEVSGDEAGGAIVRTQDRSRLWLAQTPQTFRRAPLVEALESALDAGAELTDEAMAFERLGWPVEIVPSTAGNLKITLPGDFERAEALLGGRRGEWGEGG